MLKQMSKTNRHRRRDRTQNACGRRAQFYTTVKRVTKTQLKTFYASSSEFFREIWLQENTWMNSGKTREKLKEKLTVTGTDAEIANNKSIVSRS